MKVKLETLINAEGALNELAKQKLSIAVAYNVANLVKAFRQEFEMCNEQRIKILVDMGCELNETTHHYEVKENQRTEFAERYIALMNTEVDVPEKINVSGENISISPDKLLELEPFIIYTAD